MFQVLEPSTPRTNETRTTNLQIIPSHVHMRTSRYPTRAGYHKNTMYVILPFGGEISSRPPLAATFPPPPSAVSSASTHFFWHSSKNVLSSPSNYRIITMNTNAASGHAAEASKTSAKQNSQKSSKKSTSKPAPVPSSQPITK